MIDWNLPVRTRDGEEVRILCTDAPGTRGPVMGFLRNSMHEWRLDGINTTSFRGGDALINSVERYHYVYGDAQVGGSHSTMPNPDPVDSDIIGVMVVRLEGNPMIPVSLDFVPRPVREATPIPVPEFIVPGDETGVGVDRVGD